MDSYLQWFYETVVLLRELLSETGSIYVHLDYHISHYAKAVMDDVFGESNFRNEIVVNRTRKNIIEAKTIYSLNIAYDILFIYAKSSAHRMNPVYREIKREERWHSLDAPNWSGGRPNLIYELFGKMPPKGRCWAWEKERAEQALKGSSLFCVGSH